MTSRGNKQINVDLPMELDRQMRKIVATRGLNLTKFVRSAVQHEIERLESMRGDITIPGEMNAVLAEIYLESMPAPAVIKDRSGGIQWINRSYAKTFGLSLLKISGQPITEVLNLTAVQRKAIEDHIRNAVRKEQLSFDLEDVGNRRFRAERFVFAESMVGDVSFDEDEIEERKVGVNREVLLELQRSDPPSVDHLFVPFLEASPVAMAVKRWLGGDSRILYANDVFIGFTGKTPDEVIGHTTREVFGSAADPVLNREAYIVSGEGAYMSMEKLKPNKPRWSLRFPIFDAHGEVALIGVVSPEYKQRPAPRHKQ